MRLLLAALLLLGAGCKKDEAEEKPGLRKALGRLTAAIAPADFEKPLKQLGELAVGPETDRSTHAARFERARAWLRLAILTRIPRFAADASRVLGASGATSAEEIAAALDAVAKEASLSDTDLPKWAAEGAALHRADAELSKDPPATRFRTVSETALGGGGFAPEAAAMIFARMIRVDTADPKATDPKAADPKAAEAKAADKKAAPAPDPGKPVRNVVRYACPDAVALLAPADKGPGRPERLAAFAKACAQAPWFKGMDVAALAKGPPCAKLPVAGEGAEARLLVAAFFNRLFQAFEAGGAGGQKPMIFYQHFPVEGGCQVIGAALDHLAD